MAGMTKERPLNTLDMRDLMVQWKVMKALGYKSLFDPEFRRELRNPFRRMLYYKIVLAEELSERRFLMDIIRLNTDRICFFTEPELYKKVKDEEKQMQMNDPVFAAKVEKKAQTEFDLATKNYKAPTAEEQKQSKELLGKVKPKRSMRGA